MGQHNMGQCAVAQFGQAFNQRLIGHFGGDDRGCVVGIVKHEHRPPAAQFKRSTFDAGEW